MGTPDVHTEVAPPVITPYPYGLLSIAQIVTGDGRWQLGVHYPTQGCIEGGVWEHGWCITPPDPPAPVDSTHDSGTEAQDPTFTVTYHGYTDPFTVTVQVHTTPGTKSNTLNWGDNGADIDITAGDTLTHTYGQAGTFSITATGTSPGATAQDPDVTGTSVATVEVPWFTGFPEKHLEAGMGWVHADPFTVYAGITCNPLGVPDLAGIARERLARTEQVQVEQHVWNRQLDTPEAEDLTPPNGTAVSLGYAVGILEDALATRLGGIGTIHAPREASGPLANRGLVTRDGPMIRTLLTTPVAFGAGYGPQPPPGDGTAWLYGTGPVVAHRSDVFVPATERTGGFNISTNQSFVLAERTYVVTLDCVLVKIQVDLNTATTAQPTTASRTRKGN